MAKKWLFCALIIVSGLSLWGQTASLEILDSDNAEPIEFAHVLVNSLKGKKLFVADVNGRVLIQESQAVKVLVTFVGYESLQDSLLPGQNKTVRLKRGDYKLNDVVVTAQYMPTTVGESVLKVDVIQRERIEAKGAFTLSQLLNDRPNLRLQTDGVLGTSLRMQGISGENVKVLIDGVPVIGRLNGNLDLNQLNLNDVERIEVVEGPVSVNYGSNALAGAIQIITKKPDQDKIQTAAQLFYESVGVYNTDAWLSLPISRKQALKLQAGRNFFDGWSAVDTGQRRQEWNQKEQIFGTANYFWNGLKWQNDLYVRGFQEIIKDKGDRRSIFSDFAFDNWFTTYRLDARHTASYKWNEEKRFDVVNAYNLFRRDNVQYNRNLVNRTQEINPDKGAHDTTLATTVLSRGTYSVSPKSKKIGYQIGYEFLYETGSGGRIAGNYQSLGDYAVFGSLKYKPFSHWVIQPALRVTYNTAFVAQPVPSFHFNYHPGNRFNLRGSYARGFRAPSIKELYLEFIDANHNIVGNQSLQPEYAHHADLSLKYKLIQNKKMHELSLEPSLFFNRLNNLIDLAMVSGTQFSYVNVNQMQSAGGRLDLIYSIHPDFNFRLGYSALHQVFQTENAEADFFSPEYTFGFDYWRPSKRFGFMASYKFTGASPQVQLNNEEVRIAELESYHWLDVSFSQKLWKNRIILTAGARNLFDVTQLLGSGSGGVHGGGGSMPLSWGRSFFTGIKIQWP